MEWCIYPECEEPTSLVDDPLQFDLFGKTVKIVICDKHLAEREANSIRTEN